jgi:hypothetical protein
MLRGRSFDETFIDTNPLGDNFWIRRFCCYLALRGKDQRKSSLFYRCSGFEKSTNSGGGASLLAVFSLQTTAKTATAPGGAAARCGS